MCAYVCVCVNITEMLSTAVHIRYMKCALNWCGKIPNNLIYLQRYTTMEYIIRSGKYRVGVQKFCWNERMNNNRTSTSTREWMRVEEREREEKNGCHFMGIYLFIYFSFNNSPKMPSFGMRSLASLCAV